MISTVRRPEVPLNATHEEYFETLMKDRVNLSPETKIPELSARVQFNITGGGAGTWTLVLENGYAKEVVKNYQGSHDCGLTMEGTTFMDIVRGKTTPHKALFDGKLSVSGNVLLGIKMSVLAHYL
ncbi:MAG TPA: SCP2 sterol-binding domain-containing protein [Candidatus Hypogeohydataceae bacterium YC41]